MQILPEGWSLLVVKHALASSYAERLDDGRVVGRRTLRVRTGKQRVGVPGSFTGIWLALVPTARYRAVEIDWGEDPAPEEPRRRRQR